MVEIILLILGFILLVKGADLLVEGSSALAKKLNVPTLIIGLTVVAFGTSLPEFVVNVLSAINGATNIALGNIVGSNILNTLLALGICALIYPLQVQRKMVWREIPFNLFATILLFVIVYIPKQQHFLSRVDGWLLLFFFFVFVYYAFYSAKKHRGGVVDKKILIKKHSTFTICWMLIAGLAGLYLGGEWVVKGAITIARMFGMSEFLISATIVALGTSLPEVVTSIIATIKKDFGLAAGNIVGSNIFNILFVLGATATIRPFNVSQIYVLDMLVLIFTSTLLFVAMFTGKRHKLDRWEGAILVGVYVIYIWYIITRG